MIVIFVLKKISVQNIVVIAKLLSCKCLLNSVVFWNFKIHIVVTIQAFKFD